jgi:hypothetical protein
MMSVSSVSGGMDALLSSSRPVFMPPLSVCVFVFTELDHEMEAEIVLECIVTVVGFCSRSEVCASTYSSDRLDFEWLFRIQNSPALR